MYNEIVKKILDKHFGSRSSSLTFGTATTAGKRVYYYSLPNEKEILAVRDLLGKRNLIDGVAQVPDLEQFFPQEQEKTDGEWQCVSYVEHDGGWTLRFVPIKGVRYHMNHKSIVAATLILDRYPTVTLDSRDTESCFGLWKIPYCLTEKQHRETGMSYWTNKHLMFNKTFRKFVVDFLFEIAAAEKHYILKDVARSIERCGYFLPPVTYPELIQYHTPAALVQSFSDGQTKLNVDFNKVDINIGYVMQELAPYIDRRDLDLLVKLDSKTISDAVTLRNIFSGFSVVDFIEEYYANKLCKTVFDEPLRICSSDYAQMCVDANLKIRLCYDEEELLRAHDDAAGITMQRISESELSLPLLKVPSRFDRLAAALQMLNPAEFERIGTTHRLFEEGIRQHNCVFSRRGLVRNDHASLFHWEHNGSSYTIQFTIGEDGKYIIDEVKAKCNKRISNEDCRDLCAAIDRVYELETHFEDLGKYES